MSRDLLDAIIEAIGPIALKVLAAAACIAVFAPLLIALSAPLFG